MIVYWATIAAVAFMLLHARLADPCLDEHPFGEMPRSSSSRISLGVAAMILILVAALRWGVGTDFFAYVRNYDVYKTSFIRDLPVFDESAVKGLAWLISMIWDDARMFMFVASVLTVGLMLRTITKYSSALVMSYLLFIFVGTWHGSFNAVRQYLAAAIIFASHRFILERKPLKYGLAVLLAASFHISGLAMLALYLVPKTKRSLRMIALLSLGVIVAFYASDAVISMIAIAKDDLVITEYVTRSVNPLRIAVAVAPVLLYWSRGVRTDADGLWFYRNMAVIHAAIMAAGSLSAYTARFGIYTAAFLTLALPRLIDFPDRRLTTLTRLGVLVLFGVFWYTDVSGSIALSDFKFVFDAQ